MTQLTKEQAEKLAACTTAEELRIVAKAEGIALSDDELAAIAGGDSGLLYTVMAGGKTFQGFSEPPDPGKYPTPLFGG